MTDDGADPTKNPDKDKDIKQDTKPEGTVVEENMTISKEDFANLQKQLLTLQEEANKEKSAKLEMEREHAFKELETLNPSLAKLNKDSSAEMLKIVIQTAKELKADFPSLRKENKDSQKDIKPVGYIGGKDLASQEWI